MPDSGRLGLRVKEGGRCEVGGVNGGRVGVCGRRLMSAGVTT